MKTFFYLSTCSTCIRIMKEINLDGIELKDIKTNKITPVELEEMAKLSGNYESLFSRRSMKYKALKLNEKELTETDYRQYILDEYTFLKRPVLVLNNEIYVGNSKQNVENMRVALEQ